MSSFSANAATSANAGVAQAAHNAQQLARQRDRLKAHESREAQRLKEAFEVRLAALEEGDQEQSTSSVHIDGHVPEHEHRQPLDGREKRDRVDIGQQPSADAAPAPAPASGQPAPSKAEAKPPSPDDDRLYRHLDIRA